jgi:hypothetical protein
MDFWGGEPPSESELARQRAEHEQYLDAHARWDAVEASFRDERDELDPEVRLSALSAIALVRSEFGEKWPRIFFSSGARVASFLGNSAPWTAAMLVVLARDVERARNAPGWEYVRRDLGKLLDADPALLALETGVRALDAGMRISFAPTARKSKRADVLISEAGGDRASVHVECTSIRAFPEASDVAAHTSSRIVPFIRLLDDGLQVGGALTRPVTEAELQELVALASDFYKRCISQQKPGELSVGDLLYLWATPAGHPDASQFITSHGGEVRFTVAFQHDPVARLVATIQRKATRGQLPNDRACLLVVEPSRLINELKLDVVRDAVRSALLSHSHLNAAVLVTRHLGQFPPRQIDFLDGDLALVRTLYTPIQETVVLVRNPARAHFDGDRVIDRMLQVGATTGKEDE